MRYGFIGWLVLHGVNMLVDYTYLVFYIDFSGLFLKFGL